MNKVLKQELLEDLSNYLKYLNHLLTSSLKINELTEKNDLEALDLAIDNRERLLQILKVYKVKIEENFKLEEPSYFEKWSHKANPKSKMYLTEKLQKMIKASILIILFVIIVIGLYLIKSLKNDKELMDKTK